MVASFHPEMALFRNLGVKLRGCLCDIQQYASAQPLVFLDLAENCSFLNWKPTLVPTVRKVISGWALASVRNLLVGIALIMVAAVGCGDRSEPDPSQQPAGLRKKIAVSKEPSAQTAKPSAETPAKLQEGQAEQEAQPGTEAKGEPPLPEKKGIAQPTKSDSQVLAEGIGEKSTYFYDPSGRLDPFRSPFATEAERVVATKKVKKKRVPLTPLQRIDLSQLKLVGVILSPTGNKALVEEPSGKGYIISAGTYVGTHFGRVKRVLKDRVIVEEEAKDLLSGRMKVHKRELRFPKRVGDV